MRPSRRRGPLLVLSLLLAVVVACDTGSRAPALDLSLDDLKRDPATGLPVVPVSPFDELWWWWEEPADVLDPALLYASEPAEASSMTEPSRVTILAAFPDHGAALATATGLAAAVGHPEAEAAWLAAAGVEAGSGFDWLGADGVGTPFVQVVDRWLVVDGLRLRDEHERWEAAEADGGPHYRSPLAQALRALGAEVLVEGDRVGEGAIAFDLRCDGDDARLLTLGQDLADHGQLLRMRAPWLEPPLTEAERRARRTLRLTRTLWSQAFSEALYADGTFLRLTDELREAAVRGDDARTRELIGRLQAHVGSIVPAELPDLGPLEDAIDAAVAAEALDGYAERAVRDPGASPEPYVRPTAEEHLREAAPFGADNANAWWRSGSAHYGVHLDDGRLSLNAGTWLGIAQGFEPLMAYLGDGGCDELRVAFMDFDDVRGD